MVVPEAKYDFNITIIGTLWCMTFIFQGGFANITASIFCIAILIYLIITYTEKLFIINYLPLLCIFGISIALSIFSLSITDSIISLTRQLSLFLFYIAIKKYSSKRYIVQWCELIRATLYFNITIALLSFCDIINFNYAVSVNRLQGLFQYANTMGIFIAVCIFLLKTQLRSKKKIYSIEVMIFESCLFLTQSVGTLIIYTFTLTAYSLSLDKELRQAFISETAITLILSLILTITTYVLSMTVNLGWIAFLIYIVLFILKNKIEKYIIKLEFRKWHLILILFSIVTIAVVLMYIRNFRFIYTALERMIQTSDGIKASFAVALTGYGQTIWETIYTKYQTASYTATLIHNGYVQTIVNFGYIYLLAIIGSLIIWLKRKPEKDFMLLVFMILIHIAIDIDIEFLSLSLLLILLIALSTSKEASIKNKKKNILNPIIFMILLIFSIYSFIGYYTINVLQRSDNEKILNNVQQYSFLYPDSYKINYEINKLKVGLNQDVAHGFIYNTEATYILKIMNYKNHNEHTEAFEEVINLIRISPYNENNYGLAEEMLKYIDEASQSVYQSIIKEIQKQAYNNEHLLQKYIK